LGGVSLGSPEKDAQMAYAFCEQQHRVEFIVTAAQIPSTGSAVRLVLGEPPSVVVDGAVVGVLDGTAAKAMGGCLQLAYAMTGVVITVDPATRRGVLEVQGVRQQVA
jgi:hypothetical protein